MTTSEPGSERPFLARAVAALVLLLLAAGSARAYDDHQSGPPSEPTTSGVPAPKPRLAPSAGAPASPAPDRPPRKRPDDVRIFGDRRTLVAYYGTAQTGALGVLGEIAPDEMHRRLQAAAGAFERPDRPVLLVYELIVTIADRAPGSDGDYSHDIPRAEVTKYIRAAHRHGALLLLDIQPGRAAFDDVVKRWRWALEDPYVGLALDPEWRMEGREVPGSVIGSVSAPEVNRTAGWLADLVRRRDLPEKLFVLHQFRTTMIEDIGRIIPRSGLAMVHHVDGFGTPGEKLATYRTVARPARFTMGLKLFYDEDVNRMSPIEVLRIRPEVRFVSFQ